MNRLELVLDFLFILCFDSIFKIVIKNILLIKIVCFSTYCVFSVFYFSTCVVDIMYVLFVVVLCVNLPLLRYTTQFIFVQVIFRLRIIRAPITFVVLNTCTKRKYF